MTTLAICPVCRVGDLYPHCDPTSEKTFSSTCDLVTCGRCWESGSLDGRWWQKDAGRFLRGKHRRKGKDE